MNRAAKSWLVVSGSLMILALSTLLATKDRLVLGEEYILSFAYGLPDELRLFFLVITLLGSVWILAIVLTVLLIKSRLDIASRVLGAAGLTYVITGFAKEIVGRPRPGVLIDILQRELLVFGNGFPSAHVALATAVALVLGAYLPKDHRNIILIWILLVALSRLYLGVHAPLDIIGGFCIGLISSYCVLCAFPAHKRAELFRVAKKRKQS